MTTIGLDISEKTIHLCELSPDGEIVETSQFRNSPQQLESKFGGRESCRVVLEVGCHSRWITETIRGLGHEVLVADPRRLKLISESLYKDDARDAQLLASIGLEMPHRLKTVELRGEAQQQALTLVRGRRSAVEARTKLMNSVRGLLKPYGTRVKKSGTPATFPARVREVTTEPLRMLVEPMLLAVETLTAAIKTYDAQVEATLQELAPEAMHLTTIYGVGALTVLYFVALVGTPSRVARSRSVGAYLGLVRRRDDSGTHRSELGITKAGDSYMRTLLVNCANHVLGPFGKDSELRRWGASLVRGESRADKKRARVAVARKLAVLMLTLWKSGEVYNPFPNTEPVASAA